MIGKYLYSLFGRSKGADFEITSRYTAGLNTKSGRENRRDRRKRKRNKLK